MKSVRKCDFVYLFIFHFILFFKIYFYFIFIFFAGGGGEGGLLNYPDSTETLTHEKTVEMDVHT